MNLNNFKWTREPNDYKIEKDSVEIITNPHTDLWQRTYYHFRNDNAPPYCKPKLMKSFSALLSKQILKKAVIGSTNAVLRFI